MHPYIALGILAAAAVLQTALVVGAIVVTTTRPLRRYGLLIVAAVVLALTPFAIEVAIARLRPEANRALFVDLRWYILAAPAAVALLVGAWRERRASAGLAPRKGALAVSIWSAVWGIANTVNACSPGWCGRYGFPLPFFTWSDAIITFNGYTPSSFHPLILAFDTAVLLVVGVIVATEGRIPRRRLRPAV